MRALKKDIFDINYRVIGRNIIQLRKKRGLGQDEVAERIGISMSHYSNCERAEKIFALEHLLAICRLFDVSLDQLLMGAVTDVRISNNTVEMMNERDNELIEELLTVQKGCSDEAVKYMIVICKMIANLDKQK